MRRKGCHDDDLFLVEVTNDPTGEVEDDSGTFKLHLGHQTLTLLLAIITFSLLIH